MNATGFDYSKVIEILFELEMQNVIQSIPGGYIKA